MLLRPNQQELEVCLCIPGKGFELNLDGLPLKILRKNLDRAKLVYALIQKMDMNHGSFISSQITLIAQHDSSRLGFPALIIALCKAQHYDSLTHERLSPTINLAYIKKNCWNLDDPTVTFRGPRKARGKRSEAPSTTPSEAPALWRP